MPTPTAARLRLTTALIYIAALLGGAILVVSLTRFNALHREFLDANFDAVHSARALLKSRFFIDIAARDIETAAQDETLRPALLARADRRLAGAGEQASKGFSTGSAAMAEGAEEAQNSGDGQEVAAAESPHTALAALTTRIRAARKTLSTTDARETLQETAKDLRFAARDLEASENEHWQKLATLNAELSAHMGTMNRLIIGVFALFAGIMTVLAWAVLRTRRAEAALRQAKNEIEATQQTTLDASPIGIAFIDTSDPDNRHIRAVNRQMAAIFGYAAHLMPGLTVRQLYASSDAYARCMQAMPLLADGEVLRDETIMRRHDGTPFWCGLSMKAIAPDDLSRGIVWVCEDIGERKAAESELQQERSRAEAASRARSGFLANMGHELRTPFAGLFGLLDLLRNSRLDETQQRHLQLACDSARQMQTIVNDILDFSKIEAGKLVIEQAPFALRRLIDDAAGMHAAAARHKGLQFSLDVVEPLAACLVGDAVRLRQVIDNLLSTTIRFTEHGAVRMRVEAPPEGRHTLLRIGIEDGGSGIAEAMQGRSFEEFTQAGSSTARLHGGSGLGLTVSRKLAALMGGRITLASPTGDGSCFMLTLRLPVAPATACGDADGSGEAPATGRLDGAAILLVEDNEINRGVLAETLEYFGAVIRTAGNGIEAVRQAIENPPDLILMDCQMPEMDGLEATRRIRASERGRRVPIIALTAFATGNYRSACLAAGMDRFLTKPVAADALLAEAAALLAGPSTRTPARTPETTPEAPRFAARLLLADDNGAILEATRALLERAGCAVTLATDGAAALAALDDVAGDPMREFDLVLLDCQMPRIDGYEAARRWREAERKRGLLPVAIVALTAEDRGEVIGRCHEAGMNDVLGKPFDEEGLYALLAEWLR